MAKQQKIALITGAARRIGAEIAKTLHQAGYGVVLHYHRSEEDAANLTMALNKLRPDSAWMIKADFQSMHDVDSLIKQTLDVSNRLDVLVNNASDFYPTPMSTATEQQWDDLMNCNLKAPFFLSQAAKPELDKTKGCIVNIVDIYAKGSLIDFPIYSISKSGLLGLTQSLAKEMAPKIRVNGVSPGVILWPENDIDKQHDEIIQRIPLQKQGSPEDIANAVLFLVRDALYITGEVITVDGGKGLI
ncbi:MAG: pteridine reductase [Gammaproteobacteria bacterium]|jgi:pteridine reductase